jgi:hypothetical protein
VSLDFNIDAISCGNSSSGNAGDPAEPATQWWPKASRFPMTSTRIGQPRFLVCHIKNQIRFVLGHRTQEGRLNVKVDYFSPSAKRGWQSVSEDDWEEGDDWKEP